MNINANLGPSQLKLAYEQSSQLGRVINGRIDMRLIETYSYSHQTKSIDCEVSFFAAKAFDGCAVA